MKVSPFPNSAGRQAEKASHYRVASVWISGNLSWEDQRCLSLKKKGSTDLLKDVTGARNRFALDTA